MVMEIMSRFNEQQMQKQNKLQQTALHLACLLMNQEATKLLVERSVVDLSKEDVRKRTALHYAAENGMCKDCFDHKCYRELISMFASLIKRRVQEGLDVC